MGIKRKDQTWDSIPDPEIKSTEKPTHFIIDLKLDGVSMKSFGTLEECLEWVNNRNKDILPWMNPSTLYQLAVTPSWFSPTRTSGTSGAI